MSTPTTDPEFVSEHLEGLDAVKVYVDRLEAAYRRSADEIRTLPSHAFFDGAASACEMLRKELEWIESDGLDTTPEDDRAGRL